MKALLAAAAEDIRDIKGPIFTPNMLFWLAVFGSAALLVLLIWYAWKTYVDRANRKPPETLYQKTIRQLEEARQLLQSGQSRRYCDISSGIIRHYLEEILQVHGSHQTTEEFLSGLAESRSAVIQPVAQPLRHFLEMCDLVKFARWRIDPTQISEVHAAAVKVVEDTKTYSLPAENAVQNGAPHPVAVK